MASIASGRERGADMAVGIQVLLQYHTCKAHDAMIAIEIQYCTKGRPTPGLARPHVIVFRP